VTRRRCPRPRVVGARPRPRVVGARLRPRLVGADAGADDGNAIVEFVALAVLLMVPLVYLLITVFRVQAAAYAVAGAVREAGRAFVTAPTTPVAHDRAVAAAHLALADHGVAFDPTDLAITCQPACTLTPGTEVTIRLATDVSLPLVPAALGGGQLAVGVSGEHVEWVDRYREVR